MAGLLKQFFRELPEPLLTREHYQGFIEAARQSHCLLPLKYLLIWVGIDDDIMRRDSMHATINALPDPNYATLRTLTLVGLLLRLLGGRLLTLLAPKSRSRAFGGEQNEFGEFSDYIWVLILCLEISFLPADEFVRPTLMGKGPNVADAGWQVRVIDTILQNTYQIFDDD